MLKLDQQVGHSTHDKPGQQPEIIELPGQKMVVVYTIGASDRVMHLVLPALYSSVYKLSRNLKRMGKDFRIFLSPKTRPLCPRGFPTLRWI